MKENIIAILIISMLLFLVWIIQFVRQGKTPKEQHFGKLQSLEQRKADHKAILGADRSFIKEEINGKIEAEFQLEVKYSAQMIGRENLIFRIRELDEKVVKERSEEEE